MHDVLHDRLLGADVELVLDEAFEHLGGILGVNDAGGPDAARQQLGAVAGAGFHIEHFHAGHDTGKRQHLNGMAALIDFAVGIAAVWRCDNGLEVRRLGVVRRHRDHAQPGKDRKQGDRADDVGAKMGRTQHENPHSLVARNVAERAAKDYGFDRAATRSGPGATLF